MLRCSVAREEEGKATMGDVRLEGNPLWVMSAIVVVLCSVALVVVLYLAQKKDEEAAEREKRKRKRRALQTRDKRRMRKRIQGEEPLEMEVIEGSGTVVGHTLQAETVTVEVRDFKREATGVECPVQSPYCIAPDMETFEPL